MRYQRTDRGPLSKVQKTPQGGIRAEAALTRTGVFEYRNPDGTKRLEWRPPEEVNAAASLDTLRSAPVTNLHPKHGHVTSKTFKADSVGHVDGDARVEGDLVVADLVIQDGDTIGFIETRARTEVSCGYDCALEMTPGVTPDGERYDCIQRGIVYNHVAVVPRGRAGSGVALRLDSDGNQLPEGEEPRMSEPVEVKVETVEGTEYKMGTPGHLEAVRRRDAAEEKRKKDETSLRADRDALKAQVTDLQTKLDSLESEMPGKVEARVKARVELITLAEKHGVEFKADASDLDVSLAIVKKLIPSLKLDAAEVQDEVYVKAALKTALASAPAKSAASVREGLAPRQDAASSSSPVVSDRVAEAREKMRDAYRGKVN